MYNFTMLLSVSIGLALNHHIMSDEYTHSLSSIGRSTVKSGHPSTVSDVNL